MPVDKYPTGQLGIDVGQRLLEQANEYRKPTSTTLRLDLNENKPEQSLKVSQALLSSPKLDLVHEFAGSAAYSAFQAPVRGLAQIVDQACGTELVSRVSVLDTPKQQESFSAGWHAQQLGHIVGTAVPFLLLHKAVGKSANLFFGKVEQAALSPEMLTRRVVAESMVTGALFDGLRETPVDQMHKGIVSSRLNQAFIGAATFGVLTRSSLGLRSVLHAERGVVGSVLRSEVGSTVLSGIPAGLVNAELTSRFNEGKGANARQFGEAIYSFSVLGGVVAGGKLIGGKTGSESQLSSLMKEHSVAAREAGAPTLVERITGWFGGPWRTRGDTRRASYADGLSDLVTEPVSDRPAGAPLDIDFRIRESFAQSTARLTEPTQRTEVLPVAKAFPPEIPQGTSAHDAIAMSSKETAVAVNVYRLKGENGHATEIVIQRQYDLLLDPVRKLRLAAEATATDATTEALRQTAITDLAAHKLGNRLLPEDVARILSTLPDGRLAKRVFISNQTNPADPYYRMQSGNKLFVSTVDSSSTGEIGFYRYTMNNLDAGLYSPLRTKLMHEGGHLLHWEFDLATTLAFEAAQKAEPNLDFLRRYASSTPGESVAVLLGEELLHPDAARAAEAARQAPHHSSVLAATLKQRLLSLPPEMQSPLHQQYLNRTQSVLDIARQSLLQKSH